MNVIPTIGIIDFLANSFTPNLERIILSNPIATKAICIPNDRNNDSIELTLVPPHRERTLSPIPV